MTADLKSVSLLAGRLVQARRTLVFTGAGVSTGSGIPDFRGPSGLWRTWKPVDFQDFIQSEDARIKHWEFKLAGWREFRDARPNLAHTALVELERKGLVSLVVTQNIDGLHRLAGQSESKLIELHGTNLLVECISCGRRSDPEPHYQQFEQTRKPPTCSACSGYLKPATVSFGQQMPMDKLHRALSEAEQSDLVVSIGSTLEVEPAASVPLAAKKAGAFYVIVNLGTTAHDPIADLRIEGDACQVLAEVVARIPEVPD
jgi:NAD-dependent deacetylase